MALGVWSCAAPAAEPTTSSARYRAADGTVLTVVYNTASDTVKVHLPSGKVLRMRNARAASGSRYVKGQAEFWEHHGEGTLRVEEVLVFRGKLIEP